MKITLKYLLAFILFIPLLVNARELDDLKHKWTNEFGGYYHTIYEHENEIGLQLSDELYVLDKLTGEVLKAQLSEVPEAITRYKDTYLVLTNKYNEDDSYTSTIYELNNSLEITNQNSITLPDIYMNGIEIYGDDIYLHSCYGGLYQLTSKFEIINTLTNSDGSQWHKKSSWHSYELYDKDGNYIKTVTPTTMVKFKDGYLTLNSSYSNGSYIHTLEYWDEKLEQKIESNTFNDDSDFAAGTVTIINGKTYLYRWGNYIEIKEDLTFEDVENPKYSKEIMEVTKKINNFTNYVDERLYNKGYITSIESTEIDKDGNFIVSAIIEKSSNRLEQYYYLGYYDSNYNLIFENNVYYENTTKELYCRIENKASRIDDYIVFAYHNLDEENFMEFYDLEGNLIKKEQLNISNGGIVNEVLATKNGLLIAISTGIAGCESKNTTPTYSPTFLSAKVPTLMKSKIETTILYYEFPFEIKTKTDGNGDIEITTGTADSGEKIEFEIKPKEGYKLDKVVVIDENGNKVTFNDYKFTMPSSNVSIEATFVVDNPNTSETLRSIVIIILTLVLFILFVSNKQIKLFNKIDTSIN